ncbi:MAG: GNAT family N-acetyltransferase [Novosphingobium sp.]|nr:GNAT family N-acetyltransferase [Novosphingobium sp.]
MAVMTAAFEPTWGEAWTRRQVEDSLLTGYCDYFLVSPEGKPVASGEQAAGFTLSRSVAGETELLLLAVDPQFRRRGLGALLVENLLHCARAKGESRIFLEMRRGNPAERLYRKIGFQPVGERPNYYRTTSGERIDAVTFALSI